jgi:hypothetical protein
MKPAATWNARGVQLASAAAGALLLIIWLASPPQSSKNPRVQAERLHARLGLSEHTYAQGLVSAGEKAFAAGEDAERNQDTATAAQHYAEAAARFDEACRVASSARNRRSLSFPEDRVLGELYVRPDATQGWKKLGKASGTISAPSRVELRLAAATSFTNEDLDLLLSLPPGSLQSLDLGLTQCDDSAMERVARLRGLNDLSVYQRAVSDAGAAAIAHMPDLKYLNLGSTQVSDVIVPLLQELPVLESLNVQNTHITVESLPRLSTISTLRTLLLDAKQCNDAQIHVLRNLDKLEWLGLSGPQITDVSVPVLIQLSQLKSLHLHSTALSEVALAQLQRDLKDCVVRY